MPRTLEARRGSRSVVYCVRSADESHHDWRRCPTVFVDMYVQTEHVYWKRLEGQRAVLRADGLRQGNGEDASISANIYGHRAGENSAA